MRLLTCLLLCSGTALAQENPDSAPRRRAQAFLIPMDEAARTPTMRVAAAFETVLVSSPLYEVVALPAAPGARSLSQLIASASDEIGRGLAGKNVSALAQKFSLERVLIGSVRSQEERRVLLVMALVDGVKNRIIAAKTLTLSAGGTDEDQLEAETQDAVRKLFAADCAEAEQGAPAPASKGLQGKTGTEGWGDDR